MYSGCHRLARLSSVHLPVYYIDIQPIPFDLVLPSNHVESSKTKDSDHGLFRRWSGYIYSSYREPPYTQQANKPMFMTQLYKSTSHILTLPTCRCCACRRISRSRSSHHRHNSRYFQDEASGGSRDPNHGTRHTLRVLRRRVCCLDNKIRHSCQ